jgi:hypothetical protein
VRCLFPRKCVGDPLPDPLSPLCSRIGGDIGPDEPPPLRTQDDQSGGGFMFSLSPASRPPARPGYRDNAVNRYKMGQRSALLNCEPRRRTPQEVRALHVATARDAPSDPVTYGFRQAQEQYLRVVFAEFQPAGAVGKPIPRQFACSRPSNRRR